MTSLLRWTLPLLCVTLFACDRKVPEPDSRPRVVEPPAPEEKAVAPASSATTAKGLVKQDLKTGTGPAVKRGDTLLVHYTGTLADGTKFDSSRDRDEPFRFSVGAGEVIKGWDEGTLGMKKGGIRKLTIPPELGYGRAGSPPKIPPNATLTFEIELVDIVKR
jgi:FKBP-type peptidyl-prolyl cis-trans isomerase